MRLDNNDQPDLEETVKRLAEMPLCLTRNKLELLNVN